MLQDPRGTWRVQDLTQPELARRFTRLAGQPSLGYRDGILWLRISLTRPVAAPQRWWLEVAAPLLDDIRLYVPQADGGYSEHRSGTDWPIAQRDLAYRVPVFALSLPPDTPTTLCRLSPWQPAALSSFRPQWTPTCCATAQRRRI